MWLGRKEDDKCLLLQVRKWIREENMRVKKRHSVSEQNDSDSLPSQRHNHGPSFPSSFYYTIRRFRPDRRFFILQWNKAGMKWRKILHTSIWISFCSEICSCVVQAGDHPDNSSTSTVWSPAPGWVWCSPDCTSFVEMDSRWFGWRSCSKMSATFSGTRLGTSQSSTSSLRSPSIRCSESFPPLQSEWREWYHAILI